MAEFRPARPGCAALAVASMLVAGCGGGGDEQQRVAHAPDPEHAAEVERNPYAVTCADLARQRFRSENQRLVIHAEFALAKDPALKKVVARETRNRTGRSVYYAMTELCKHSRPSFEPARPAIEAVRQGKYLAARNRPG
jgi:hypothetical protein